MDIRFFNDWGPDGKPRLLIGVSTPVADRGEAREAVRVATPDDVDHYPAAYEAYRQAQEEAARAAAPAGEPAAPPGELAPRGYQAPPPEGETTREGEPAAEGQPVGGSEGGPEG